MSDWTARAGDQIRQVQLDDGLPPRERVVNYVGPQVVVFSVRREGVRSWAQYSRSIDTFYADYELVPEVFDAGKTYAHRVSGAWVDCVFANDEIALIKGAGGNHYVVLPSARDNYAEVQ